MSTKKTIASTKTKASKGEKGGKEKPKKSKLTPKDVAEYFLKINDIEGDFLSNLKIQKLLYYAQGYSLALNNKPLFKDDFVAWMKGPAIPDLHALYRKYVEDPVPVNQDFDIKKFTKQQRQIIEQIQEEYAQFSVWKLEKMVSREKPMLETKIGEIIPKELIKDFFYIQIKYNELKKKKNSKS